MEKVRYYGVAVKKGNEVLNLYFGNICEAVKVTEEGCYGEYNTLRGRGIYSTTDTTAEDRKRLERLGHVFIGQGRAVDNSGRWID